MPAAITLENVSKMYRLGQVGTGTLAHDLNRWWSRIRGKGDPFAKIGQENNREQTGGEYVWALKDINLEVQQGEILGIIGRNGAGKSTLLKLLSRVTAPTTGRITVRGRMASLLEVGTGFHPELTGRENIYLNGAILGMTRAEIRKQFDEIVDFSGCAKYVDTPVKRYSSGMYVRLAFAVAAHLEPDILVVDEVLAVGDAEFQAKCLGKMNEVSREHGRTILFVSHNMGAMRQLCPRSILLANGRIASGGSTEEIIERYLAVEGRADRVVAWMKGQEPHSTELVLRGIRILDSSGGTKRALSSDEPIDVEVTYRVKTAIRNLRVGVSLYDGGGSLIFLCTDYTAAPPMREAGEYTSKLQIPANFLIDMPYVVEVSFEIPRERSLIEPQSCGFHVLEMAKDSIGPKFASRVPGLIHPDLPWSIDRRLASDSTLVTDTLDSTNCKQE